MRDPVSTLVAALRGRGVTLQIQGGKLRCRGEVTAGERKMLAEYAPIVQAILSPDETLPDDLFIPADCPMTTASIKACIDSQRVRKAA